LPDSSEFRFFVRYSAVDRRTWEIWQSRGNENHADYRLNGTRYRDNGDIYACGAIECLTYLKKHLTMNLERFMIRSIFALYPGLVRKGIWIIVDGIFNDSKNEEKIEFVDEKASSRRRNEASVICAAVQEHREVLGLANPTEEISELKNDEERYHPLILCYFVFLDGELERESETELGVRKNELSERRKAPLLGNRVSVVPLYSINSHVVSISSRVLHGIMREICSEFSVSREEFTGENRETYWKNIFDSRRQKVSKQKVFTGMIETDGVAICVHHRRLKVDRSIMSSASPVKTNEDEKGAGPATQKVHKNDFVVGAAKHEDEKEAGPATQKVHKNEFVVGADPGTTNIITIAESKRAEDGIYGNLRQKDMRLLRFSRAR